MVAANNESLREELARDLMVSRLLGETGEIDASHLASVVVGPQVAAASENLPQAGGQSPIVESRINPEMSAKYGPSDGFNVDDPNQFYRGPRESAPNGPGIASGLGANPNNLQSGIAGVLPSEVAAVVEDIRNVSGLAYMSSEEGPDGLPMTGNGIDPDQRATGLS